MIEKGPLPSREGGTGDHPVGRNAVVKEHRYNRNAAHYIEPWHPFAIVRDLTAQFRPPVRRGCRDGHHTLGLLMQQSLFYGIWALIYCPIRVAPGAPSIRQLLVEQVENHEPQFGTVEITRPPESP
jgi:hypothetical protein